MDLPLTLRQLQYFVAAADAGSMTAAGAAEHVSQSAVSLAISDLERALGTQLFLRHRARGLTLTPAGRHMVIEARAVLARATDLVSEARSLGEELRGPLTVACYDTIAPFVMPGLLTSFRETHPHVDVELREGDMATLRDLLMHGQCELFLAYDLDIGPGISVTELAPTTAYVLLPEGHRLAKRKRVRLTDLADEPLVLLDQPQPAHFVLGLFEAAGAEPTIGHRASSFELVRSLVARGIGCSVLIQRPAGDLSYEGLPLQVRPLHDAPYSLSLVVAAPEGAHLTRRARAFVDHCGEHLGSGALAGG